MCTVSSINLGRTQHGIYIIYNFIRNSLYKYISLYQLISLALCYANYTRKVIYSFNLTNTFYDLFRHIHLSPDSHMKIKLETNRKQDYDRDLKLFSLSLIPRIKKMNFILFRGYNHHFWSIIGLKYFVPIYLDR